MSTPADIDCPVCQNRVTAYVIPGEEAVYYPNEKAHPGSPPELDFVEGCECIEAVEHFYRKFTRGAMGPTDEIETLTYYEPVVDWYHDTVIHRAFLELDRLREDDEY